MRPACTGMSRPRDPFDWVEGWAWPIIEREHLPGCADLVLLRLAAHADRDGLARPSARRLAKLVGRSERAVRDALDVLRARGHIAGEVHHGKVTVWTLVTERTADPSRAPDCGPIPQSAVAVTADPSRGGGHPPTAEELRRHCGGTADPSRDEGEGEVLPSFSSNGAKGRGAGEGEVEFDLRDLVVFRGVA